MNTVMNRWLTISHTAMIVIAAILGDDSKVSIRDPLGSTIDKSGGHRRLGFLVRLLLLKTSSDAYAPLKTSGVPLMTFG